MCALAAVAVAWRWSMIPQVRELPTPQPAEEEVLGAEATANWVPTAGPG